MAASWARATTPGLGPLTPRSWRCPKLGQQPAARPSMSRSSRAPTTARRRHARQPSPERGWPAWWPPSATRIPPPAAGRAHVTPKCAMTLDGKIAAFDHSSRWITGEQSRAEAHRLRSEVDAIVVGIGTATADDPALTVRLRRPRPREPWRVVVDSRARLPVTARMITSGTPARALLAVTEEAPPERLAALEAR